MKSIDSLVKNLLKYAKRPEWEPLLFDIWHEHLDHAADVLGISAEAVTGAIEENDWHQHLFGLVFEDFATRGSVDVPSFARVYLQRAGWREAPQARRYLEAMADSSLGLYEVVEVQRERGLKLRDLVNDGAPIFVREKAATLDAARWDVLAARVVEEGEGQVLTGGILLLERQSAKALAEVLKRAQDRRSTKRRALQVEDLPLLVTAAWLSEAIDGLRQDEVSDAEGEPLLFGKAKLPLKAEPGEIARRLDTAREWRRTGVDPSSWVLVGGSARTLKKGSGRYRVISQLPTGEVIFGHAELAGDHLEFSANSHESMESGIARLRDVLGDAIGSAVTVYQPPHLVSESDEGAQPDLSEELSAEELASIKQALFDRHYRETMRSRIPALGDKTPRQALRSKVGRQKVLDWLKEMERSEARRASQTGEKAYDFAWMWQELGLFSERE